MWSAKVIGSTSVAPSSSAGNVQMVGDYFSLCRWFEVLWAMGNDLVAWLHLVGVDIDPADVAHLETEPTI